MSGTTPSLSLSLSHNNKSISHIAFLHFRLSSQPISIAHRDLSSLDIVKTNNNYGEN
jgi:hypothetical protein